MQKMTEAPPTSSHLPQTEVSLCLQKGTTVLCPFGGEDYTQPGGRLGFHLRRQWKELVPNVCVPDEKQRT